MKGPQTKDRPTHRDSERLSPGRSDRWIKVKNRAHAAFSRVLDAF